MTPHRSLLFVPGHRAEMHVTALESGADAVVFDLEDSVPAAEKARARELVAGALERYSKERRGRLYVRISSPREGLLDDDIATIAPFSGIGLIVPKIDRAVELQMVFDRLPDRAHDLIVNVETPRALLTIQEISDTAGVGGLFLGGEDLTESLGMVRTAGSIELSVPRFLMVVASRAAGIAAYDTVCPEFRDLDVVRSDATTAASMGFDGKFAIHPAQIEPINQAFTPGENEIAEAQRIVEAFDAAVREGHGAVAVDGKMIDPPVAERARNLLARANRRQNVSGK